MSAAPTPLARSSSPDLLRGAVRLDAANESVSRMCRHCGSALESDATDGFCCSGCATVFHLLRDGGLTRYYDLRGCAGVPVPELRPEIQDTKWLEPLEARIESAPQTRLELDLQGLQCTACVWLIEQLFRRRSNATRIVVNPALGTAQLIVSRGFALRAYVSELARFGYLFGPATKRAATRRDGLLVRIGVCSALAMNAMIFSLPLYLGLREGVVFEMFRWTAFALSSASVAVGGSLFVRSAWLAARRRVVHLDLPIALGIVLAFSGSTFAFVTHHERGTFFDTISVFIALMLVGRWTQERVIERNRRALLGHDGFESLSVRRVRDARIEIVPFTALTKGDTLLVGRGEAVPVDGVLRSEAAQCSLDWIRGESEPHAYVAGEIVPAGALNAGAEPLRLEATTDFAESDLVPLLRSPTHRTGAEPRASRWWQRLSTTYVLVVLAVAFTAFLAWWWRVDAQRGLEIATAVLVVTCPCAFGIATPLAYEFVQQGLRRAALFIQRASFLDRAPRIRTIVFDKTGTLTTGIPVVANPGVFDALAPRDLEVLATLAAQSNHPCSVAVHRALAARHFEGSASFVARELPGIGLEATIDGHDYRLGLADAAARTHSGAATYFVRDGVCLAAIHTLEHVRPGAREEIARLRRAGYRIVISSGDSPDRVAALGASLGLAADDVRGGCSPSDKAAFIAATDRDDTLMIGDGLNDALAAETAYCSGTPAIDRPFMPGRTDFYFTTPGLRPIGLALRAARALEHVNRRNLAIALAYNTGTVGLACAGLLTPLLCAALMPLSSLALLLTTTASLSRGASLWR